MKTFSYLLSLLLLSLPLLSFVVVNPTSFPSPPKKEIRQKNRAAKRLDKLQRRLDRVVERRHERGRDSRVLYPFLSGTECDTLYLFDGSMVAVTVTGGDGRNVFYKKCPADESTAQERLIFAGRVKSIRYGNGLLVAPSELSRAASPYEEDIYRERYQDSEDLKKAFRVGAVLSLLNLLGLIIAIAIFADRGLAGRAILGWLIGILITFALIVLIVVITVV